MRARVTGVHIGQDFRCHQIAEPHASRPRVLELFPPGHVVKRILERAPDAAELAVTENAQTPAVVDLPVVAGAHRAEPARATLTLIDRKGEPGYGAHSVFV